MLSITSQQYYLEEGFFTDKFSVIAKKFKEKVQFIQTSHERKIQNIERKLEEKGVNVTKIKQFAKSISKTAKIKNGKISNLKAKVNQFVNDFYNRKYFDNEELDMGSKLVFSLLLLAIVTLLNSFMISFFMTSFSPVAATTLSSIFVAPIVEETAKLISIKNNFTGTYYVIFNMAEFSMYVCRLVGMGASLATAIMLRIPPLLLHLLTTIIQSKAHKEGESGEGWTLAVMIHALWNTLFSFM